MMYKDTVGLASFFLPLASFEKISSVEINFTEDKADKAAYLF